MRLFDVYVRFFRSFNFDFMRQDLENPTIFPWDGLPDDAAAYYPFVKIPIERDITTVVGANEAGKTQLIDAICCLLGERTISTRDFCRYSEFFGVTGHLPRPEFGGRFAELNEAQAKALQSLFDVDTPITTFYFFRLQGEDVAFLPSGKEFLRASLEPEQLEALGLPRARRIKADIELPSSASLYDLRDSTQSPDPHRRSGWLTYLKRSHDLSEGGDATETIADVLGSPPKLSDRDQARANSALGIVRDLLEKITDVDPDLYALLLDSTDEDDGYADALTAGLTSAIGDALNFSHWWSQDKNFSLRVAKDGFHLVLTMVDKTGQSYTFKERSGGMKYFLSYFIQRKAYAPEDSSREEILLMDEPDAYLSTQGQQDLLRVISDYADPENGDEGVQLLYVTHSPFLIDKNHPERIRVLQKAAGEEGTRVVEKASTDEFEPLRSAFASFHAQTAFIGTCNLLVEGVADMILFSGLSSLIRRRGFPGVALDLNDLTMVPVHGASQYRYMIHLTRGRKADRPAVIVLLDSDNAGGDAEDDLADLEKGFGDSDLLDPTSIFAINQLPKELLTLDTEDLHEPEDLVPATIARMAALHFAGTVVGAARLPEIEAKFPAELHVAKGRVFDVAAAALKAATADLQKPLTLTKPGFAQSVVAVAGELSAKEATPLVANFSALFQILNEMRDSAMVEHERDSTAEAVSRLVDRYRRDHRERSTKKAADYLFGEILDRMIGSTHEEDRVRQAIRELRDEFALSDDPLSEVTNFEDFRKRVRSLKLRSNA